MTSPARRPAPPYPDHVRLLKGALISIDETHNTRHTVPFQYNPATLERRLEPHQLGQTEAARTETLRFTGAATEIITLEAHLESVDSSIPNGGGGTHGVYPLLSALELFAYPSTQAVSKYESTLESGAVDIVPPLAPRLVFVWGPHRVLPVRLVQLEIREQMFNASLSPITAVVQLTLRVLTYSDVPSSSPDFNLFLTHQQHMESMAAYVPSGRAARAIGTSPNQPQES